MNTHFEPGQVADIPLSALRPDPDQPRKVFDEAALQRLADSLKGGVQVPLLVRPKGKTQFTIHDGERRYRAAKLAKLKTLPALVLDDGAGVEDIRVAQLAVNQMREQLKPMEIARTLADLQRNHFKSINELQAHLEAHGMPSMKPKQIRDLVALVDLPEWVHEMIDAGTVSKSAATQLKVALPFPEVVERVAEEVKHQLNWSRKIDKADFQQAMDTAFERHHFDLNDTSYWRDNPVLFDHEKVCKGCEHLVRFGDYAYCTNREGFERHQAEAKEAGLGPGGEKLPERTASTGGDTSADEKAEKRAEQLERKVREYFHAYLIGLVEQAMLDDVLLGDRKLSQIDINDELLAWACMDKPGQSYYNQRGPVPRKDAAADTGTKSLETLFEAKSLEKARTHAAIQVLREMCIRETLVISHQLWGDRVENVWRLDAGYLALLRKAELVEFAQSYNLESANGAPWSGLKVADLREEILVSGANVAAPAMLAAIYDVIDKPREPCGWDDD